MPTRQRGRMLILVCAVLFMLVFVVCWQSADRHEQQQQLTAAAVADNQLQEEMHKVQRDLNQLNIVASALVLEFGRMRNPSTTHPWRRRRDRTTSPQADEFQSPRSHTVTEDVDPIDADDPEAVAELAPQLLQEAQLRQEEAKLLAVEERRGRAQAERLDRVRGDGRCGPRFPAPGAPDFGECDPQGDADQVGPCCNPHSGWCGNIRDVRWGHCDCVGCVDFSRPLIDPRLLGERDYPDQ